MRVLVAPDSFKESLTAAQAARAIARGVAAACPGAEIVELPLADGGEGTVDALVNAEKGQFVTTTVTGPLGQPVEARWGMLPGGRAVMEMAAASGLALVPSSRRDPLVTTTYGTGQLLSEAVKRDCRSIILGIGGSATNDGGAGALQALGVRLLDKEGQDLPPGGGSLKRLDSIDTAGMDPRLKEIELLVACDVNNTLLGPQGASAVYGPQKGANPADVTKLDEALANFAYIARQQLDKDISGWAGSGAAGGLAAGLSLIFPLAIKPGIELVLDSVGFDNHLTATTLVITGEGRIDRQSAMGKALSGILQRAGKKAVPVIALAGSLELSFEEMQEMGLAGAMSIVDRPMTLATALTEAELLLERAASQAMALFCLDIAKPPPRG